MAGKRFDPDRLAQRLAPHGFVLNLPETMKGGISFVRPSKIDRLYDHLLIRAGTSAFVDTAISAATFTSCHKVVSEEHYGLRSLLSGDSELKRRYPHMAASHLATWAEARAWQKKLIENADVYCNMLAAEKGLILIERLRDVFRAVDSYVTAMGKLSDIFSREFAYVSAGTSKEKIEVSRLADQGRSMYYLDLDDARLASAALLRFGPSVEDRAFQGVKPHRDAGLAARLILLADYIRRYRNNRRPENA
jgi:hypothetical protein